MSCARIEGSPVEENSLRINPMLLSSMSVSLLMSELASVKRTTSRLSSNVASCKSVDRIFADFFDIWTSFRQEAIKFHMAFLLCKGVEPPHLPAPANAHIWGCYNCWQDTAGTNLSTHRQNWFASLDPAAFPGRLEEFEHRQWHKHDNILLMLNIRCPERQYDELDVLSFCVIMELNLTIVVF